MAAVTIEERQHRRAQALGRAAVDAMNHLSGGSLRESVRSGVYAVCGFESCASKYRRES